VARDSHGDGLLHAGADKVPDRRPPKGPICTVRKSL
jgi:hypothetical protein